MGSNDHADEGTFPRLQSSRHADCLGVISVFKVRGDGTPLKHHGSSCAPPIMVAAAPALAGSAGFVDGMSTAVVFPDRSSFGMQKQLSVQ